MISIVLKLYLSLIELLYNNKGGVGKTTTTLNLAATLTYLGKKTLVVDFDVNQQDLTNSLKIKPAAQTLYSCLSDKNVNIKDVIKSYSVHSNKNNRQLVFDIIPADDELAKKGEDQLRTRFGIKKLHKVLESVKYDYDYILIDSPPNWRLFSQSALYAADVVLIPNQVIGNAFIYAVAEEAGLERVWCIIADDRKETVASAKILSRESLLKINLSTATRDEIQNALQYLIEQPGSLLNSVKISVATDRIEEAPRQYWKTFDPISQLKCGITKGKKLKALEKVFYLTPQPMPDKIEDPKILQSLTTTELKKMAKKQGLTGYSKKKKAELVQLLSQ